MHSAPSPHENTLLENNALVYINQFNLQPEYAYLKLL